MTEPCPHGEPHESACAECLAGPPRRPLRPQRPPEVRPTRPVTARYPGHCSGCNLAIHEGQAVVRVNAGPWVHAYCADGTP